VIGGGFYGCSIAERLATLGADVVLYEREAELLERASYRNQARLHGGYHYPRSYSTAYRSRFNFFRFVEDFRPAITTNFIKLYAIARADSMVTGNQFETFCRLIDAPIRTARKEFQALFSPRLIEAVYETEEYVFDAAILRRLLGERLALAGVEVRRGRMVTEVGQSADQDLWLMLDDGSRVNVSRIYNCTYSALNAVSGISPTVQELKHELTELALIELPLELTNVSVTVMDGPFFSFMPFPDRHLSTLSHVRYTPHTQWTGQVGHGTDPRELLTGSPIRSKYAHMIRDAQRYVPSLGEAKYRESLFEVKTVLARSESDDGRPILFEHSPGDARIASVLGSKIDNVYDVLSMLEFSNDEN
jgi:glycine/D-amino acid oxidase-like deaminating enzyme